MITTVLVAMAVMRRMLFVVSLRLLQSSASSAVAALKGRLEASCPTISIAIVASAFHCR